MCSDEPSMSFGITDDLPPGVVARIEWPHGLQTLLTKEALKIDRESLRQSLQRASQRRQARGEGPIADLENLVTRLWEKHFSNKKVGQ